MGFWDGLGRVVRGEPVFQVPQTPQSHNASSDASSSHSAMAGGAKQIARAFVEETETHTDGHHMRVMVKIKNESAGRIELDKISLMGNKRELDMWLNPHQEREFIVYDGEMPTHRNYDDAWLDYKDETGDYFQQYHTVEFEAEGEGRYSIKYLRPSGPTKDI
jgi:hypothetical protein